MRINVPDISNQIYSNETLEILLNNYSDIGPLWAMHQAEWTNNIYQSFKDFEKYLIIIYLINKTLIFYSKNFSKLTYDQFYSKESVEIEKFNISDISINLNIPKETARRKVLELEEDKVIQKIKKKIIIDRSSYIHVKPINSIERISRFLTAFSNILFEKNIIKMKLTSSELEKIIKNNFSYVWKLYYECQIPMLLSYKNFFGDLETSTIFGSVVVNQHLNMQKINKKMTRTIFFKNFHSEYLVGMNAMSISDITGIPRATVVRKLKKLIKLKILSIDKKKHYTATKDSVKKLIPIQEIILEKLSYFSTEVFNLAIFNKE
jgi:DNA-binding Lrp family transcriptional regulator